MSRCQPCALRIGLLVAAASALLSMQSVPGRADEMLYHFLDERGVPHFSNQPFDARYRPLAPLQDGTSGAPAAAPSAEVTLATPDQAALGETFEVTISMAAPAAGNGFLELSFDPEALALQAISVDASVTEPGRIRVEFSVEQALREQTLVNLGFQAVAAEPTQASIQVTQLELHKPNGEPVPVYPGAWASVRLVQ